MDFQQKGEHIPLKRALIVTRDSEETIESKGMTIEVVPVWKWILE